MITVKTWNYNLKKFEISKIIPDENNYIMYKFPSKIIHTENKTQFSRLYLGKPWSNS